MHIDDQTYTAKNGKTYRRALLRNSYRLNGEIKHDTIANLSKCDDDEIEAFKFALKNKHRLSEITKATGSLKTRQGLSVGAVWTLLQLAKRLGIAKALGSCREAQLVLWLVMASLLDAKSRLSAVRLAGRHAVADVLNLDAFTEDDLYAAMDWLAARKNRIEDTLYRYRYGDQKPALYLYDVTSTYLEGVCNILAAFGYNRDGKRGKMQLVIGLLTDAAGWPISIQVFEGNTSDTKTVADQIKKLAGRFGVKKVTFVGDRGMIKSGQVEDLQSEDFYHITAITKAQIEKLIKDDVFQLSMFDEKLCEVVIETSAEDKSADGAGEATEKGVLRYVLRRNPQRAKEIAANRDRKLAALQTFVDGKNTYLAEHPKAQPSVALRESVERTQKLKIDSWATVIESGERTLSVQTDADKLAEASRLDGCYVIKSDVPVAQATADVLHDRYKDLKEVEWAFRTMKTTLIEMRGVYVRTEAHTRAHVFIVMLAYQMAYELRRKWVDIDLTIGEGLAELAAIDTIFVNIEGVECQSVPEPRELGQQLLNALGITLPDAIPNRNIKIEPRKKIKEERRDRKTK